MTRRWLPISIAVFAAASLGISLTSCNEPACGPGTVQTQEKDGSLKCIPTDVQAQETPCDVDAGMVKIVGGECVPAVVCDPSSTITQNGTCYGTSGGPMGCRTPASNKACIFGTIYDFTTNTKNTVPVDALLFDATTVSSPNPTPIAVGQVSADGSSFVFQDFVAPSLKLVLIVTGKTTMMMVPAGTGGQNIVNNTIFHIDGYALKQADVAGWGFDITTGGAQIARFFNDPASIDPTTVTNTETHPQSGVTLTENGGAAAGAQYFNDMLTQVSSTMMMTGASGTAIISAPIPTGSVNFPDFSGMGGGVTAWESFPGGSEAGLVLITRFHPTM